VAAALEEKNKQRKRKDSSHLKESQDSDDECTKVKQDADDDDASDEPKAVPKASNIPALGKRKPIIGSSGIGGLNSAFKRKK
jgi:hypothetical protein